MPYFLTREQYAPGSLYITDASLDLVRQWCEATGERLRCYFVGGYVDPGDVECADEYPAKYRLSVEDMRTQIEALSLVRARDAALQGATVSLLTIMEVECACFIRSKLLESILRVPCQNPLEAWKPIVGHTQEE